MEEENHLQLVTHVNKTHTRERNERNKKCYVRVGLCALASDSSSWKAEAADVWKFNASLVHREFQNIQEPS